MTPPYIGARSPGLVIMGNQADPLAYPGAASWLALHSAVVAPYPVNATARVSVVAAGFGAADLVGADVGVGDGVTVGAARVDVASAGIDASVLAGVEPQAVGTKAMDTAPMAEACRDPMPESCP